MTIAVWPLALAIIGALVFAISNNAKASEFGRWLFIVGLFWFVAWIASRPFPLPK